MAKKENKITNPELLEFAKVMEVIINQKLNKLRSEFDDDLMALAPPPEKQIKEVPKNIIKSGIKKVTLLVENNDGKVYRYTVQ